MPHFGAKEVEKKPRGIMGVANDAERLALLVPHLLMFDSASGSLEQPAATPSPFMSPARYCGTETDKHLSF